MEHIRLYEEGEYQYAGAFGFIPTLTMYLREDAAEALPLVLVVPGGGYRGRVPCGFADGGRDCG